jgi:hypothetical protein
MLSRGSAIASFFVAVLVLGVIEFSLPPAGLEQEAGAIGGFPESIAWPLDTTLQPATRFSEQASSSTSTAAPVASLIDGLTQKLAQQPDDAKGWALLAQSHSFLGNDAEAQSAMQRAVDLGVDEQTLRDRISLARREPHPVN